MVDHDTLLTKLELMQISSGWFKSYLSGHLQCVKVENSLSKSLPITIGTFQGTVLGPLLYNIASMDLACHIPDEINGFKINLVSFADDSQIGITGPRNKIIEIQKTLEEVLEIMSVWFMQHGMKVNASKTEFIICGDRRQLARLETSPTVTFMGERLRCTDRVRNLGVTIDSCLTWEYHVKLIQDRCFGILIGLRHAKHLLPAELLPRIIDALVKSHIRYGLQVYGNAGKELLKKIEKVINFAARIISGRNKFEHISDVISQLGWLKVHQMIDYSDLCLLHKVLTTGTPAVLADQLSFNRDHVARRTRQSEHLALAKQNTNHGKNTFIYRASKLYNQYCAPNQDVCKYSQLKFKKYIRDAIQNA